MNGPKAMSAAESVRLPTADIRQSSWHVGSVPILLQKSPSRLCEIEICNDRIGARASLNRCCAFAPDLESMLRDKMLKILLQHNRLQSGLWQTTDGVSSWAKASAICLR